MKSLKVIVTGAGAPGIKGTLYSLKQNYDNRQIFVIGTDIHEDVIGKYLCDKFYTIPSAKNSDQYLEALLDISIKEKIDLIIPQNTAELLILAKNKEKIEDITSKVLIPEATAIEIANNKYKLMKACQETDVPIADFFLVNNQHELENAIKKLGWPEKKVAIKPPVSNGSRGFRIIDEKINLKTIFYDQKPTSVYTHFKQLQYILGDNFPSLIVTEFLPGKEYTVDVFMHQENYQAIPRSRDLIKAGITFNGSIENRRDLIRFSKIIADKIGIQYTFGFQFKENEAGIPQLLECNPRIQGTMVLSTFAGANVIYDSIKAILNEEIPESDIKWDTQIMRYWGGIGIINKNNLVYL